MNRFWSPVVAALDPYVPGEQPQLRNLVKLNTNESPYGPSPLAIAAMADAASDDLRLYPDPESTELRHAVAGYHGVGSENVFVGNGSDEVLAHVFRALFDHKLPVRFPDISYSFYPVYCALFGIPYESMPLTTTFDIAVDAYAGENGGIVFPNPNAPTGKLLPLREIERLLQSNPDSVVVVDEAYIDFGGETAVSLTAAHDNLLVVQTLSKSRALAGLRVGFAIGHAGLVEALTRVKNSFNSYPLSRFAQAGATAAIRDVEHFDAARKRIMATRDELAAALEVLGFEVLPSKANFLFARHGAHRGAAVAAALRERGIIVRHFDKPRIENFLRITVGTDEQCDVLVEALREIVG